jgi:hypothetical protein
MKNGKWKMENLLFSFNLFCLKSNEQWDRQKCLSYLKNHPLAALKSITYTRNDFSPA